MISLPVKREGYVEPFGRCLRRLAVLALVFLASSQAPAETKVVFLGTGTPLPDPDRSGPCTAIVVNGTPYLVDAGPGLVRRATSALRKGVTGLDSVNLKIAFVTHLHSDHTAGLPDLIFTPWVMGRNEPIDVYGPKEIASMTDNILKAWQVDIDGRAGGIGDHHPDGCKVHAHEIAPGVVHRDRNVTVTAFSVRHEEMVDSFGFRFDTPDRVIVMSGDTTPTQTLIDHSRGCDVLIHEAYSMATYHCVSARAQDYRRRHHTSSIELAAIANEVKPELLVIYHRSNMGGGAASADSEDVLLEEIRAHYKGQVVAGHDLDVF